MSGVWATIAITDVGKERREEEKAVETLDLGPSGELPRGGEPRDSGEFRGQQLPFAHAVWAISFLKY